MFGQLENNGQSESNSVNSVNGTILITINLVINFVIAIRLFKRCSLLKIPSTAF